MRRAAAIVTALILLICLTATVFADTAASAMNIQATVYSDGSARVTVQTTLHLDTPQESLVFPLPRTAQNIQVNGSTPSTSRRGETLEVDLAKAIGAIAGDISVVITYTLPSVVARDGGTQNLTLSMPLLCGFPYSIEECAFSVTLPDTVPGKPTLTSTYYQTRIEEDLTLTIDANQISGRLDTAIMGSDWLTLTLKVSEEMFPQEKPVVWTLDLVDLAMIGFAVLAVVYWLVFLRCLPPRAIHHSTAPEGISAGDIGSALTMCRADLTMLVVQWAQLGYILIQLDDNGRVWLHKRMNMGNERSQYEGRIFRSLFGTRSMIDGTGFHYAQLCRKVAAGKPGIHGLFQRGSGNPGIFRLLAAMIGLFGGVSLGIAIGAESLLQNVIAVLMGIFGLVSSWLIQEGGKRLHLRRKFSLWLALGLCAVWLILGVWANELITALCIAAAELLAGLAAAYGGRRTDLGRQASAQILGLRRYLKSVTKEELQRILRVNPDYYYTLAPYALALGVDQAFAKRFGNTRLPACPYLTAGMDGHLTALEWSRHLRDAVNALDERQQQLALERLLKR